MNSLNLRLMIIHPARKAQMALLFFKEVTISTKYANIIDVFSKESVKMLSERISINKYAIE